MAHATGFRGPSASLQGSLERPTRGAGAMGDLTNPYSAPRANDEPPFERLAYGDGWVEASQGQRFANLLIDYFCYFGVCLVLGAVLGVIGAPEVASFVSWPVYIGYYVFFESVLGATPGKLVTKT